MSTSIQQVINLLDEFRDEYNVSTDPEIKKLCGYVSNTIDGLNAFKQFFANSKSKIEQSQAYYEASLDTITKLIADSEEPDPGNETEPGNEG